MPMRVGLSVALGLGSTLSIEIPRKYLIAHLTRHFLGHSTFHASGVIIGARWILVSLTRVKGFLSIADQNLADCRLCRANCRIGGTVFFVG